MAFTSWAFARFFAVVLAGLWLLPRPTLRQALLLLASAYFYAQWEPSYVVLLAMPILVDYGSALAMERSRDRAARARWLGLSVATNLGLLASFKCAGSFFSDFATPSPSHALDAALPIGVSFFTLRSLSYTIDVYRGDIGPCRSLWRYALFLSYFPALAAGPIVRASTFLPQLVRSLSPSRHRTWVGLQIVLLGLTKKLVIADQIAPLTNAVFADPSQFSPLTVASGVFGYSLEIYCDFSGYSDIAIGVSHIIGLDLPANFDMPYLSTSLTEFWRRWHITFSRWLRDYLYVPLGGNRRGTGRTCVNVVIVFVLGGLWHGVSPTFVLWGLLHGIGLAAHKLWLAKSRHRLHAAAAWLMTYLFVCAAWIPFRSHSIGTTLLVLRKVAGLDRGGIAWFYSPLFLVSLLVVVGHLVAACAPRSWTTAGADEKTFSPNETPHALIPTGGFIGGFALTAWVLLILLFAAIETSPFLYLQF